MTVNWTVLGVLVGGICVIAIYSFLYKENPLYRFFEHVFIGVATGYGVVLTVIIFVWPKFLKPTLGLDLAPWESFNPYELLMFLPFVFGCGILFILSRKHGWIARIVIGAGLGMSGGLAFKGFFAHFVPLLVDSFKPLVAFRPGPTGGELDLWTMVEHFIFVVTLLCVMTYFFFSFEHDKPVIKQASFAGRYLMMITFGAFFGATVMARMALLIDRLQFLTGDWVRGMREFYWLLAGG